MTLESHWVPSLPTGQCSRQESLLRPYLIRNKRWLILFLQALQSWSSRSIPGWIIRNQDFEDRFGEIVRRAWPISLFG